jgi:hypothetical protein
MSVVPTAKKPTRSKAFGRHFQGVSFRVINPGPKAFGPGLWCTAASRQNPTRTWAMVYSRFAANPARTSG